MEQNRLAAVKTILWDVDGTLLNFLESERIALQTCMTRFGLVFSERLRQMYSAINDIYWKRLERGEITKPQVYRGRFEEFFGEIGAADVDPDAFNDQYQEALGEVYVVNDDAITLCRNLKGRFAQYAVTNGSAVAQQNKLRNSGLDRIMDRVFISEQVGFEKPDIRFFERCFAKIPGFKREETLIVGDSLTSDMRGGNNAGILCCWYNPAGLPAPDDLRLDAVIGDLQMLPALLGQLPGGAD